MKSPWKKRQIDEDDCPHPLWRRFLSEVYGTTIMVFMGTAGSAQCLFSRGPPSSLIDVNLAWAFGICFGIYSAHGVSGGHVNPSISVSLWCLGRFPLRHLGLYFLAHLTGSFIGCLLTFIVYHEALDHFDGGLRTSIGDNGSLAIWTSVPAPFLSPFGAFIDQILGTAMLGVFIAMATPPSRCPFPPSLIPLLFGLNALMLGSALGLNMGCPLNPARDFAPRFLALLLGYPFEDVFPLGHCLAAFFGPLVGAVFGTFSYILVMGHHIEEEKKDRKEALLSVSSDLKEQLVQ